MKQMTADSEEGRASSRCKCASKHMDSIAERESLAAASLSHPLTRTQQLHLSSPAAVREQASDARSLRVAGKSEAEARDDRQTRRDGKHARGKRGDASSGWQLCISHTHTGLRVNRGAHKRASRDDSRATTWGKRRRELHHQLLQQQHGTA